MFSHGNSVAETLSRTILTSPHSCGQSTFQCLDDFACAAKWKPNDAINFRQLLPNYVRNYLIVVVQLTHILETPIGSRARGWEEEFNQFTSARQHKLQFSYCVKMETRFPPIKICRFIGKVNSIWFSFAMRTMAIKWPHTMNPCKNGLAAVNSPTSDK